MSTRNTRLTLVYTGVFAAMALAAIVFIPPIISKMTETTAQPIEREEIMSLKLAILAYQTEYNRLPDFGSADEVKHFESTGLLIDTLVGKNEHLNPDKITFYELPKPRPAQSNFVSEAGTAHTSEMDVRDPWGNCYRLHFDWNGDKRISSPKESGEEIPGSVLVYSAGRDGDYSTWEDNFTSWE